MAKCPLPEWLAGEEAANDESNNYDYRNSECLLSTYYVPGSVRWIASQARYAVGTCYFCHHFTGEEIET